MSARERSTASATAARVTQLFVHPIKSAAAIPVDVLSLDALGAVGDRRWLVVDAHRVQITARETTGLALVVPTWLEGDRDTPALEGRQNVDADLRLDAPGMPPIHVAIPAHGHVREVRVWDDLITAHDAGDAVAEWMSQALGRPCRLTRLAAASQRALKPKYAGSLSAHGRFVAFTDGAPLLVLGQASLDALNGKLAAQGAAPMSIARFRPNIVFSGADAHAEDAWTTVKIGEVLLSIGAPCERCVMTTINPRTGEKGVEPLRTLATYRRQGPHVVFGMNATNFGSGRVRLGDALTEAGDG